MENPDLTPVPSTNVTSTNVTNERYVTDGRSFVPSRAAKRNGYVCVNVDVAKLAANVRDVDVSVLKSNRARVVVAKCLETGIPIEMPQPYVSSVDGRVGWTDGRHTFGALRAHGAKTLYVAVPNDAAHVFEHVYGADETGVDGTNVTESVTNVSTETLTERVENVGTHDGAVKRWERLGVSKSLTGEAHSEGDASQRERERVAVMKQHFPGVEFSAHASNPLGVKEAKETRPWAGLPLAKYDKNAQPMPEHVDAVKAAASKHGGDLGYLSFNDAAFESGLGHNQVFGAINHMRKEDPNSVSFTVNRIGDPVYFKIKDNAKVSNAAYTEPNPTEAQKAAGNYAKRKVKFSGMDISIENEKGGTRSGKDKNGKEWSVSMPAAYGYLVRVSGDAAPKSADSDHVDAYLNEPPVDLSPVFIIDQVNADDGSYDEPKTFLGFPDVTSVRDVYERAFSDGLANERIGKIHQCSLDDFKRWLTEGDTSRPFVLTNAAPRDVNESNVTYARWAQGDWPDVAGETKADGPGVLPTKVWSADPNDKVNNKKCGESGIADSDTCHVGEFKAGHVEDEHGRSIIHGYHGSGNTDIKEFKPNTKTSWYGSGAYVTEDPEVAHHYATYAKGTGKVYRVRAQANKLLVGDDPANIPVGEAIAKEYGWDVDAYHRTLKHRMEYTDEHGVTKGKPDIFEALRGASGDDDGYFVAEHLQKKGYDAYTSAALTPRQYVFWDVNKAKIMNMSEPTLLERIANRMRVSVEALKNSIAKKHIQLDLLTNSEKEGTPGKKCGGSSIEAGKHCHIGEAKPEKKIDIKKANDTDRDVAAYVEHHVLKDFDYEPIKPHEGVSEVVHRMSKMEDSEGWKSRVKVYGMGEDDADGIISEVKKEGWPVKGPMAQAIDDIKSGTAHPFVMVGKYVIDPHLRAAAISHDDINKFGRKLSEVYERSSVPSSTLTDAASNVTHVPHVHGKASTSSVLGTGAIVPHETNVGVTSGTNESWKNWKPAPKWSSAGAVVFNDKGQVAIIKPKGKYGGSEFVWPKGTIEAGEAHEAAAHREVAEESGHKGVIVDDLGTHEGSSSHTHYFLMKHESTDPALMDKETESTHWVSPEEAAMKLDSVRDLRVLALAMAKMQKHLPAAKA